MTEADASHWQPDAADVYCPRCGANHRQDDTQRLCAACAALRLPWHSVVRLGAFEPPLSDWIHDMKFHQQWAWARTFGQWLADMDSPAFERERVCVCPVPMHWRRRWWRGYNQAALIAEALAKQRGVMAASLLRRTRATWPQTQVAPSQRSVNVSKAFAPQAVDLDGYTVLLVDDVKTSGATLRGCARALRQAGAAEVHVAVVAVA